MTKILIIEDEPLVRENLQEILELEGFQIFTAKDGKEGLEAVHIYAPDLILCDLMMPILDGYGVLEGLKKEPKMRNIPFILLTAKSDMVSLRSGMQLGADDYITKPYDIDSLLNSIQNRLEKKASLLEEAQLELNEFRYHLTKSLPQKVANLTHQLQQVAATLKQVGDHLSPQEVEELADKIEENSGQLQRLWINFSLYSQLEMIMNNPKAREAYRAKRGVSVPSAILNQVATNQSLKYQRLKDVKLTLQDTKILISSTNFKKIMEELIDNAFLYSPNNSGVEISSEITDTRFNLLIRNQSSTIAPEILSYVNSFHKPGSKFIGNTIGLGLEIAKSLVELNDGTLRMEFTPENQVVVALSFALAR